MVWLCWFSSGFSENLTIFSWNQLFECLESKRFNCDSRKAWSIEGKNKIIGLKNVLCEFHGIITIEKENLKEVQGNTNKSFAKLSKFFQLLTIYRLVYDAILFFTFTGEKVNNLESTHGLFDFLGWN